jgi:hypothetical protein
MMKVKEEMAKRESQKGTFKEMKKNCLSSLEVNRVAKQII